MCEHLSREYNRKGEYFVILTNQTGQNKQKLLLYEMTNNHEYKSNSFN